MSEVHAVLPHALPAAGDRPRLLSGPWRIGLSALVVAAAAALAVGLVEDRQRTWLDWLASSFYLLSVALWALAFVAVQHVTRSGWSVVLRRVPEAMSAFLPVGAALLALVAFGFHDVYHWSHAEAVEGDPVLRAKSALLNPATWLGQVLVFAALWTWFRRRLVGFSRRQDQDPSPDWSRRALRTSAACLVAVVLTFTVASITWLMSVEPHWFSTLYPWYAMASGFVGALALLTALVVVLSSRGLLPGVGPGHLHDLGKHLFAFSVLWGYLWFCQFMLIWYANIPEETVYYAVRLEGAWRPVFVAVAVVNLGLPFLLLPVRAKKDPRVLLAASVVLFLGHWLDHYMAVLPSAPDLGPRFGLVELALTVGLTSLFVLVFDRAFAQAAPVPTGDPYLVESLHHHT